MTDDHRATHVRLEVERAQQALAAARKLRDAGLLYDAAARAYYAAFHYARALGRTAGADSRTHQGVAHQLALHFVRTGILPPETARIFAALQKWRQDADYDAAFVLDAPGPELILADAAAFTDRAHTWLVSQGLLPP